MLKSELYYDLLVEEVSSILLSSPLLLKIDMLPLSQLRYVFSQLYYFVDLFPGLLAALLWQCPDERIRFAIVENLVDECGGIEKINARDFTATHSGLLKKFVMRLDRNNPLFPTKGIEVDILINSFKKLFIYSSHIEALGAMASMEGMSTKWFGLIYEKLLNRHEFSSSDLLFFEIHLQIDDGHGNAFKEVLMPLLKNKNDFVLLRHGILTSVNIWKTFYENLAEVIFERN